MLLDSFSMILIAIYVYIIFMLVQQDDYSSLLIATLFVCIILCYRRKGYFSFIEGFHPNEFAFLDNKSPQDQNQMAKHFKNVINKVAANKQNSVETNPIPIVNDPNLLYNNVSSYDGLCLKTGNKEFWSHSPNNVPLINNDVLYTTQGYSSPLKPVKSDPSSLSGPSLDGTEDTPHKMFMFANNVSSPNCCPSTFSTSTGCVCTTDKQRDFVASRGFNNL